MPVANDIRGRALEIQGLICTNQVSQAVKLALDFVRDFSEDRDDLTDIILISNNHSSLEQGPHGLPTDNEDLERRRNKILVRLLDLVYSIQEAVPQAA